MNNYAWISAILILSVLIGAKLLTTTNSQSNLQYINTGCITLTSSNTTYSVTKNILPCGSSAANVITFASGVNNVLLNCNGHSITTNSSSASTAIKLQDSNNKVTIANCLVYASNGIFMLNSSSIVIKNTTFIFNLTSGGTNLGISALNSNNDVFKNITILNQSYGINLNNSYNATIENNKIRTYSATDGGIYLSTSNNVKVYNNTLFGGYNGIGLNESVGDPGTSIGIVSEYSSNINISNNNESSFKAYGFDIDYGSNNIIIKNNKIYHNNDDGLVFLAFSVTSPYYGVQEQLLPHNIYILNNTINNNGDTGIELLGSNTLTISNNTFNDNTNPPIFLNIDPSDSMPSCQGIIYPVVNNNITITNDKFSNPPNYPFSKVRNYSMSIYLTSLPLTCGINENIITSNDFTNGASLLTTRLSPLMQTIKRGQTADIVSTTSGGVPPYSYSWLYYSPDFSTYGLGNNAICSAGSGKTSTCIFATNSLTTPGLYTFGIDVIGGSQFYGSGAVFVNVT